MNPMLCSPITLEEMRKLKGYIFEPKYDGARAMIVVQGTAKIFSRDGKDITHRWPEITKAIDDAVRNHPDMPTYFVLDGEIVVRDPKNSYRPSFNLLQQRLLVDDKLRIKLLSKQLPAAFFCFDILDIPELQWTLTERHKVMLKFFAVYLLDQYTVLNVSQTTNIESMEEAVKNFGFEGIVAKRSDSTYQPGARNHNWYKWKKQETADCIVMGYTEGEGKRKGLFGALVLAQYREDGKLQYVGKVGTGFTEAEMRRLLPRVFPIKPGVNLDNLPSGVGILYYKQPGGMVVEVKYMERSKDGILRQPVYVRERTDKNWSECVMAA